MLPNLKVENLSSVRSEKVIFDNINFDVMPGQNIEIIGSNGSGKTTLLRTISVSYTHLTLPTIYSV